MLISVTRLRLSKLIIRGKFDEEGSTPVYRLNKRYSMTTVRFGTSLQSLSEFKDTKYTVLHFQYVSENKLLKSNAPNM